MMLILNDVAHNIHAKTGSFAYGFGGEEVFKESLFYFVGHAFSVVSDGNGAVVLLLADTDGDLGLVISGCTLRFIP